MKILGQPHFAIRADKIIYISKSISNSIYIIMEGACEPLSFKYQDVEDRENNYQLIINAMKEACDEQDKDKR